MKKFYYLYNGRSALNFILKNHLLEKNQEILFPDFSCDVLFQNDNYNHYRYKFYPIKRNFKISLELIKKKITKKTRVILIINFFGITQNLKNLFSLCKKKKILLIVDDCHTFYRLNTSKDNDCDVKFFSPSKIFEKINIGGILQINNNSVLIHKKLKKSLIDDEIILELKRKIKKILMYEQFKFFKKRPKYEDYNFFKSKFILNDFSLNKKSIKKIEKINITKEKEIRKKNFKFWKLICKKINIKPLIKIQDIQHGCPLFFPALCKNKKKTKSIFDLAWKYNIDVVSWPSLHSNQKKNKKIINYWNKLVYFPMDKDFYQKKELLNDKKFKI